MVCFKFMLARYLITDGFHRHERGRKSIGSGGLSALPGVFKKKKKITRSIDIDIKNDLEYQGG